VLDRFLEVRLTRGSNVRAGICTKADSWGPRVGSRAVKLRGVPDAGGAVGNAKTPAIPGCSQPKRTVEEELKDYRRDQFSVIRSVS